jgi:hypothetical protein
MTHTILLVQPERAQASRTFADYESVPKAMDGVCAMFEARLKQMNPSMRQITYDVNDLYAYIDSLPDLSALVFVAGTSHAPPAEHAGRKCTPPLHHFGEQRAAPQTGRSAWESGEASPLDQAISSLRANEAPVRLLSLSSLPSYTSQLPLRFAGSA